MKVATRKERVRDHARGDIVEAATRAFARKGFHATTMQEIAAEAGYTAPSLYSYFPSKEAIFDGLVESLTDNVLDLFALHIPETLSFPQRVEVLLDRLLSNADTRRDAFHVFFTLRSEADPLAAKNAPPGRMRGFHIFAGCMVEFVRKNAAERDLHGRDPEDIAHLLAGVIHSFFLRWLLAPPSRPFVESAPLILDLFLHGALGRPGCGADPGAREVLQ